MTSAEIQDILMDFFGKPRDVATLKKIEERIPGSTVSGVNANGVQVKMADGRIITMEDVNP